MKVKFVNDNDCNVYNTDGLTKGFVYDVIAVSHKNRHLLKIQNDNNYIKYYHKDLFIEVYEDIEHNILSYLSEDSINKLPNTCEEYKNCIESIEDVYEVINKYRGIISEIDAIKIANAFKAYPEISHDLTNNLLNTSTYIIGISVTKDTVKKYKGKKYKFNGTGPARIIHENDEYLIGKKIYFKSL